VFQLLHAFDVLLQSLHCSYNAKDPQAKCTALHTHLFDDSGILAVAYDSGDLFAPLFVVAVALIWQLLVSSFASVVQHNLVPSRVQLLLQV
jgi:hypothetical protein